jgi:FKBP-type peptidyl-prolyl cis-trans isomerase SlyD
MSSLAVAADTVVTLSYELFDHKGEIVDGATVEEPLTYLHGYAQILPGLEKGVEGMRTGEKKSFVVEAEEAFGEQDDEGIFEVERSEFPDSEGVVAGDEFVAEGPDGEPFTMRVVEVRGEALVVDTNHPLAGQRVRFEVEVREVRAANEGEIAEAQAELEEHIAAEGAGCCDHDHGDGHAHDHGHDHAHGEHAHGEHHAHDPAGLVQISKKLLS